MSDCKKWKLTVGAIVQHCVLGWSAQWLQHRSWSFHQTNDMRRVVAKCQRLLVAHCYVQNSFVALLLYLLWMFSVWTHYLPCCWEIGWPDTDSRGSNCRMSENFFRTLVEVSRLWRFTDAALPWLAFSVLNSGDQSAGVWALVGRCYYWSFRLWESLLFLDLIKSVSLLLEVSVCLEWDTAAGTDGCWKMWRQTENLVCSGEIVFALCGVQGKEEIVNLSVVTERVTFP